tara:strand:+ start:4229 stop:5347 length:1119 start_codon:yes stop_codon:yes gene_type:complete
MLKILITGDYCPVGRIETLIKNDNANLVFNNFIDVINEHDIRITNLESPFVDKGEGIDKTGPYLKADEKAIEGLSYSGFNLVTLANNHIMDYGKNGLFNTMRLLDNHNIDYVGAGSNKEDARKISYIDSTEGIIAILNFAENEFSNTFNDMPGANPHHTINNYYDIQEAKKKAKYIIVIYHGGNEMHSLPSPRIKETFRFFADVGADIVVSHHTHCFSGYEIYNGTPIFYGLGNFIFDYNQSKSWLWSSGFALSLTIKDKISFEIKPFLQNYYKNVGVHLMDANNLIRFNKELIWINSIIKDDQKLEIEFDKMTQKRKKQYLNYLEPYEKKIFVALRNRGFIPSSLSKKKKLLLTNLIRCEAHRDIVLKILN